MTDEIMMDALRCLAGALRRKGKKMMEAAHKPNSNYHPDEGRVLLLKEP
jgi:hypothetical protein